MKRYELVSNQFLRGLRLPPPPLTSDPPTDPTVSLRQSIITQPLQTSMLFSQRALQRAASLSSSAWTTSSARAFSSHFSNTTPTASSSSSSRRSSFDLPDPRSFMSYQNTLDYNASQKWNPQLSKIVATIGPTSEQLPVLQDIVRCGMRVMRLNFSHATVEEVELRMANLAACKVYMMS